MSSIANTATSTPEHWEAVWSQEPRLRVPSGLNVAIRNLQALLRSHVRPGMRFLELGCAPGKMLAWVAARLQADVAGLDYSPAGTASVRKLFQALGLTVDIRCEDLFATTFPPASFDVVYSAGLIEHFETPAEIVERHFLLVKPGGQALIVVPHYGGLYGKLQTYFDPDNLKIHNLKIMDPDVLLGLVPNEAVETAKSFAAGRLSPWIVNFDRRLGRVAARVIQLSLNAAGLLQPLEIPQLCPLLVLQIKRGHDGV